MDGIDSGNGSGYVWNHAIVEVLRNTFSLRLLSRHNVIIEFFLESGGAFSLRDVGEDAINGRTVRAKLAGK